MKKYATVLTILAVILVIHVLVFFSCVYTQKDSSVSKTPEKPESEKPFIVNPTSVTPTGKPSAETAKTPISTPAPIPQNPNYGKPFIYEHAVIGNIASLPASKNTTSGIMVDLNTRQVLWAKNQRKGFPIASMTKIMTSLLAYEDVVSGRNGVTLETPIKVTAASSKIGGSQVYLDPKETFTLRELLKATSIKSANDAAYLIAEYLGNGSVASFVSRMNSRAAELRMPNTKFYNPNGLPGATASGDNISSPEGMARLAEETLRYPELIQWASTWMDSFRPPGTKGHIQLKNHNYLIPGSPEAATGVDGLKTGFIRRSGFCLTATCLRDNRRIVVVVTGFPMRKERDHFVSELLDWGYERAANPGAAVNQKEEPKNTRKAAKKKPVRKKTTSSQN